MLTREKLWIARLGATDRSKGYNIAADPTSGPMLGKKHSAKSCAQMSEKRKGIVPVAATKAAAKANKGRNMPREAVARTKAALTGIKRSKETKAKIKANHWSKGPRAKEIAAKFAAKLRGRKLSKEHKAAISAGVTESEKFKEAMIQSCGRELSEEHKAKIAAGLQKSWDDGNRSKTDAAERARDREFSEETRRKLSENMVKRWREDREGVLAMLQGDDQRN